MRGTHTLEHRERDRWRYRKKSKQTRDTHTLESREGGMGQGTEIEGENKSHLHPGKYRRRVKSEHRQSASERGTCTSWRAQVERQVRYKQEASKGGVLTVWRAKRWGWGPMSGQKSSKCGMLTSWRTQSQDIKRKWENEWYSRTSERRRDRSWHRKEVIKQ